MLTMEEALKQSTIRFAAGEIVKGTIIEVRPKEFLVDIHYKSEGVIPTAEFLDPASRKGQFARLPHGLFHGQHNVMTSLLPTNRWETGSAHGLPRLHCLTDQTLRWQRRLKVR